MRGCISKFRCAFLLLLALAAIVLCGCASTESDNMSERPWNSPQNWENGLPSSMYNQYR
jgi:outer membrane biogenesis lipoprotein LolB